MEAKIYDLELNKNQNPYLKETGIFDYSEKEMQLISPELFYKIMNDTFHLSNCAEENSYVIGLNAKMMPLGFFHISKGSINMATISIRSIMIRMLLCGAVNMVIIHNHPSNITTPSNEDLLVTQRLIAGGRMMEIDLQDHIIIGRDNYHSIRKSNPELFFRKN